MIRNHENVPYLARWNLFELWGLSIKIHLFLGSDFDKNLHSHPFYYFNFLICGKYIEHTEKGAFTRKTGFFSFQKPDYLHRIELFKYDKGDVDAQGSTEKPVLTFFATYKPKNGPSWGYKCPKGIVDYSKFNYEKGCE